MKFYVTCFHHNNTFLGAQSKSNIMFLSTCQTIQEGYTKSELYDYMT